MKKDQDTNVAHLVQHAKRSSQIKLLAKSNNNDEVENSRLPTLSIRPDFSKESTRTRKQHSSLDPQGLNEQTRTENNRSHSILPQGKARRPLNHVSTYVKVLHLSTNRPIRSNTLKWRRLARADMRVTEDSTTTQCIQIWIIGVEHKPIVTTELPQRNHTSPSTNQDTFRKTLTTAKTKRSMMIARRLIPKASGELRQGVQRQLLSPKFRREVKGGTPS